MKSLCIGMLCAVAAGVSPALAAPRYTLEAIEPLDVSGTDAVDTWFAGMGGFNDAGQIAMSWYHSVPRGDSGYRIHLYTPGIGYESMMPTGAGRTTSETYSRELNALGDAAGYLKSNAYVYRAGGTGYAVPSTGGMYSGATGINDRGDVAGFVEWPTSSYQPFVYTAAGGFQTLPYAGTGVDINNNGQVLVSTGNQATPMWIHDTATGTATSFGEGLGIFSSNTFLNDRGDVAMTTEDETGRYARLYHDGTITTVRGVEGSISDSVEDFNNRGWVLGMSALRIGDDPLIDFFLHVPGEGSFSLASLVDAPSRAGWSELSGFELNERGDIAGVGVFGGKVQPFVLHIGAPVPEPATALLVLAGLGVVFIRRRLHP
jgi:hypothetical protein